MIHVADERPTTPRNRAVPRPTLAGAIPAKLLSKTTNRPLKGRVDRNTAKGRRVADLFHAYLNALGSPTDAIVQSNALTAAELKVAAEEARKALLDGNGDAEQLVRLENLAHRAERRLGIKAAIKPSSTIENIRRLYPAARVVDPAALHRSRN
jgi:hypothetical protein